MTLARALAALAARPGSEEDLVSVMDVFSRHVGEGLRVHDVVGRTGLPAERIEAIAQALAQAHVLDFDGADAYRYDRDVAVEMELQSLRDRLRACREHLQGNVARFRAHRDLF